MKKYFFDRRNSIYVTNSITINRGDMTLAKPAQTITYDVTIN